MSKRVEEQKRLTEKVAHMGLNELRGLSVEEFDELFLLATTPTIRELDGATDGVAPGGEDPRRPSAVESVEGEGF